MGHPIEPNLNLSAAMLSDVTALRLTCPLYLRRYIDTADKAARGLAQPATFGWIFREQIEALRTLYRIYPEGEQRLVKEAVELYLKAQLRGFYTPPEKSYCEDQSGTAYQ